MIIVITNSKKECCISPFSSSLTFETSLIYCVCAQWQWNKSWYTLVMFHMQECVLFCFYINSCSAENTDTALFSGVYPSVASDSSYCLVIITVCDIKRPKWLVCIQNAGNEKFKSSIKTAKMNGNTFLVRARSEGVCVCVCVCVPTIFTSNSYIYFIVLGAITKCLSVCPSVHPSAWNDSPPTGQIFMKFWYLSIFLKPAGNNTSFIKIWQE